MQLARMGSFLRTALLCLAPMMSLCCGGSGAAPSDGAVSDGASNDQSRESLPNDDHPASDTSGQQDAPSDAGLDGTSDAPADVPVVAPTITGLSPSWLSVGQPELYFTLLVYGRDLPEQARVAFDGNLFTAQFVSTTQLQVSIPTIALGIRPRLVQVLVERALAPSLSSNILTFEITAADAGPGN
jgi:IPT/TIG domain-containing protein